MDEDFAVFVLGSDKTVLSRIDLNSIINEHNSNFNESEVICGVVIIPLGDDKNIMSGGQRYFKITNDGLLEEVDKDIYDTIEEGKKASLNDDNLVLVLRTEVEKTQEYEVNQWLVDHFMDQSKQTLETCIREAGAEEGGQPKLKNQMANMTCSSTTHENQQGERFGMIFLSASSYKVTIHTKEDENQKANSSSTSIHAKGNGPSVNLKPRMQCTIVPESLLDVKVGICQYSADIERQHNFSWAHHLKDPIEAWANQMGALRPVELSHEQDSELIRSILSLTDLSEETKRDIIRMRALKQLQGLQGPPAKRPMKAEFVQKVDPEAQKPEVKVVLNEKDAALLTEYRNKSTSIAEDMAITNTEKEKLERKLNKLYKDIKTLEKQAKESETKAIKDLYIENIETIKKTVPELETQLAFLNNTYYDLLKDFHRLKRKTQFFGRGGKKTHRKKYKHKKTNYKKIYKEKTKKRRKNVSRKLHRK